MVCRGRGKMERCWLCATQVVNMPPIKFGQLLRILRPVAPPTSAKSGMSRVYYSGEGPGGTCSTTPCNY